ncbi:hypothetical protein ZWY2020_009424 [Hordeum vulgare]|nr:hypothetical protein ZWY2020_009424 [Hordeum vulgare]
MAAAAAATTAAEQAPPPPPARPASLAAALLFFEAMEGGRGEGAGGPTDLSRDMAVCERCIAQGRGRTAEAASTFGGAILYARSLAQYGGVHNIIMFLSFHTMQLGQALSMRPDILPSAYCQELSKLQDQIPPFPTRNAIKTIESELGSRMFDLFADIIPEPIAAASLVQVYKAYISDSCSPN